MSFILVRCAYDIYIKLPKETEYQVTLGGHESVIRCTNRQGELIFAYQENDYEWIAGGDDMVYTTIFGMRNEEKGTPLRHIAAPISEVHFERGGMKEPATYTVFEILFNTDDDTITQEILDQHHDLAMAMLSYFIETYRYVMQDETIITPNKDEYILIEHLVGDGIDHFGDSPGIMFKPYSQRYNQDLLLKKRRIKYIPSDERLKIFSDRLKNGKKLDLYLKLLMEAKMHGRLRNEFDISIVKSETAVEIYVQSLLILLCEIKNINKLGDRDYVDAVINGNIRNDLLKPYLKYFGIHITDTKEYFHWCERCYKMRNEIVHRGRGEDLTEVEARAAFEAANSLIKLLESEAIRIKNSDVE